MAYLVEAACLCNMGKVRKNNEDNFFFDGRCLPETNKGLKHPVSMVHTLRKEICVAVFDGMGGENFGEAASFAAADGMQSITRRLKDYFFPEKRFLKDVCEKLNDLVLARAHDLCTSRMGATMVALYFSHGYVYSCNLGDSRAYRLRDGEFLQLSVDHVEKGPEGERKKAPLTQHLGIDPEDMQIEPYIAKGKISKGDTYLLCSDGLTDMLTNFEISDIMLNCEEPADCVQKLIQSALKHGGRDNITVIVCRID